MDFTEMQQQVHDWAESKEWNDPDIINANADPTPLEEKLAAVALIHAALSQEVELLRKGQPGTGLLERIEVSLPPIERVEGINAIKVLAKLTLVHTEVSEAVEAVLEGEIKTTIDDGKPVGLGTEIADTHIRLLHLSSMIGGDSAKDYALKMDYNAQRPIKHGKLA